MVSTTHKAAVFEYVDDVLSGRIVAGRYLKMACGRFLTDIEQAEAKGWYLDHDLADRVCKFIETLEHTKGQWAGQPFVLTPSQKFIIWNVFGFRWEESDLRRFALAYLTVARWWGKSTFCAAIAIVMLYFDEPFEPEAEGYAIATKEDQAARITTQAWRMIDRSEGLRADAEAFKYREIYKSIVLPNAPYAGSCFKALGSDSKTADSMNPSFNIEDEQHEWRQQHVELKEKIETGDGKRQQCVTWIITTAGSDDSVVWIAQDQEACKVLESADHGDCVDDSLFAFVCRIDETRPCACGGKDESCEHCRGTGEIPGDDPLDERVWRKAHPDLGVVLNEDLGGATSLKNLRRQATRARNNPALLPGFKRYFANSKIRSSRKVINEKLWAKAAGSISEWQGNCNGAWDIGWRDDLAAIAAVKEIDGIYQGRVTAFIPADGPRDLTRQPWPRFIESGELIVCEGSTTDLSLIEGTAREWTTLYGVGEWAFDETNSKQMADNLIADGIPCVAFPQSYKMYNEPIRQFLQHLADGKILHDGGPLLAWCASNLCVKEGPRLEWMPDKIKSPDKIDPIVALLMAFGRCLLSQETRCTYYEDEPLEMG